jgi:AcrR family transcriptional regulator
VTESVKPKLSRAEQARATRRRIVAAAAAQFVAHGYGATLLDQVAAEAGVAVQTVYFHFGNKRTLLKEALDVAAVGDDDPVPLMDRPWVKEIQQETDPIRIIVLWLATGRTILDRIAPLMRVVRGATSTDPEVAAQWDTNQAQTRTANGFLADLLARRGALRPGLDVEQARDIAFVLSNAETYLQFTDVCGWTADDWQERTAAVLTAALLTPVSPP